MIHREVNLSDLHAPFHDPHAWALAVEIVRRIKPDKVNLLGDIWDFYKVSHFDKNPDRIVNGHLQGEIDVGKALLRHLLAVFAGEMEFIPGNHCIRMIRFLLKHQELWGLQALQLPNLLGLTEMGIKYSEHEIEIVPGRLVARHGDVVRKYAGYSAKAELERDGYGVSTITGHTHRLAAVHSTHRDTRVVGVENGCLCDLDPEYVRNPNWQHGLSIVEVLEDGEFAVTVVPFLGRGDQMRAIVFGQEVSL